MELLLIIFYCMIVLGITAKAGTRLGVNFREGIAQYDGRGECKPRYGCSGSVLWFSPMRL